MAKPKKIGLGRIRGISTDDRRRPEAIRTYPTVAYVYEKRRNFGWQARKKVKSLWVSPTRKGNIYRVQYAGRGG